MTQVLVAPQEFKGSLTAAEAARAIASGVRRAAPEATIVEAPMSDGGAGLVDALLAAQGGRRVECVVHDPLMREVTAAWALLDDGSGAIEMAAASGLVLVAPAERQALVASTYGSGELIRAALDRGCSRIVIGVGGSATTDAGAGAISALGVRLLDASGTALPPGGAALKRLKRIDMGGVDERLGNTEVVVACDVTATLTGPQGAPHMFAKQKGASPADIEVLENALRHFAEIARKQLDADLLSMPGGGAAGGLAAGLTLLGATIVSGFEFVAKAVALDEKIRAADLVFTGEGRLDEQSALGKTTAGVARMADSAGKPVVAIAGTITSEPAGLFDLAVASCPEGTPLIEAMRDGATLVADAAERAARVVLRLARPEEPSPGRRP